MCQTCNNDHDAGMFRKLLKNLFTHRNCLDYLVILCLLLIINLDLIYFFFLGTVQESLSLITTTACFFRSLVLVVIFLKMIKLDDFSIDQMCIEETHEKHVAIWKETSLWFVLLWWSIHFMIFQIEFSLLGLHLCLESWCKIGQKLLLWDWDVPATYTFIVAAAVVF